MEKTCSNQRNDDLTMNFEKDNKSDVEKKQEQCFNFKFNESVDYLENSNKIKIHYYTQWIATFTSTLIKKK